AALSIYNFSIGIFFQHNTDQSILPSSLNLSDFAVNSRFFVFTACFTLADQFGNLLTGFLYLATCLLNRYCRWHARWLWRRMIRLRSRMFRLWMRFRNWRRYWRFYRLWRSRTTGRGIKLMNDIVRSAGGTAESNGCTFGTHAAGH